MSLRVNQNVLAIQTHGTLSKTSEGLAKSLEKLSSGLRINRAADDAAGLAISEKIRRQVRGLSRAILNAQDGISMIQTAEGALDESHNILQRMRELAIQSGNDTLTTNDRLEIQKEVNTLRDDLNRIARNTEFNTKKLLDGSQTALISSSAVGGRGVVSGLADAQGEYRVQVTEITAGTAQQLRSNIFTVKGTSNVASTVTKLEDIAQFYDNNGVFLLDSAQHITLNGNARTADIQVTKDLSLGQLATLMENAIRNELGIADSRVNVNLAGTEAPGTLQVVSGRPGRDGRISISSDQGIVNALGLTTLIQEVDSVHQVRVTDLNGANPVVGQTSTGRTSGLLPGIDIAFDAITSGAAIGKQAKYGLGGIDAISFQVADYRGTVTDISVGTGGATNSFSLDQIVSVINSTLSVPNTARVRAQVVGGKVEFYSLDTGSAAYISIYMVDPTATGATQLGLAAGRYTGSGGTTAQAVGYGEADLDYTAVGQDLDFDITDSHGNTVNVYINGTYATLDALIASINDQISGSPTPPMVRAYNSAGVVLFRSLESGSKSNFTLTDILNLGNKLKVNPITTSNGTGGSAASLLVTPDATRTIFGFDMLVSVSPQSMSFVIADHLGNTTSIVSLLRLSTAVGDAFMNINHIVSVINDEIDIDIDGAARVNASASSDNRLIIRSLVSGEGTMVGITDTQNGGSFGTFQNFGILSGAYKGTGAADFRLHVVNNRPQYQIGADQGQIMQVAMLDMTASALGVDNLVMTSTSDANLSLGKINIAIDKVSAERSKLGAYQNRLEHAIANLRTIHTNLTSAESRLRDADMAMEMIGFTRNQIVSQSGTAMLAQANLAPQGVLQLLR